MYTSPHEEAALLLVEKFGIGLDRRGMYTWMNGAAANVTIPSLFPLSVSRPIARAVQAALGLRQLGLIYEELRQVCTDRSIVSRLLQNLNIEMRVSHLELDRIPRTGAVLLVVNHPSGLLDGAVLIALLSALRSDLRILANQLLTAIPELRDVLIPVAVLSKRSAALSNSSSLRKSVRVLGDGGLLVAFPAGEVSRFCWRKWSVTDSAWNPATSAILRLAQQGGVEVSVVPVYLDVSNSLFFHAASLLHPRLPTLLLGRELLNKRGHTVEVRIGNAISGEKILSLATDNERVDYLRWRAYLLASRHAYKPRTALPMGEPRDG